MRDVLEAIHATDEPAILVEQGIEIGEDREPAAVGTFQDQLAVADRTPGRKQLGHGGEVELLAIGRVGLLRPAKPISPVANGRRAAPKLSGTPVVVNEVAVDIAGVDADGEPFQKSVP